MTESSIRKRQEDELLKYAYVEVDVKKQYAIRYNGYPDDLPHFFARHVYDVRRLPRSCPQIEIKVGADYGPSVVTRCNKGDWILVKDNDDVSVLTDIEFREQYNAVDNLNYE